MLAHLKEHVFSEDDAKIEVAVYELGGFSRIISRVAEGDNKQPSD